MQRRIVAPSQAEGGGYKQAGKKKETRRGGREAKKMEKTTGVMGEGRRLP